MPDISDIIKDSVVEFSRLQDWMLSAKEHGDMDTYYMMHSGNGTRRFAAPARLEIC